MVIMPNMPNIQSTPEIFGNLQSMTESGRVAPEDGFAFQNILEAYMGIVNDAGHAMEHSQQITTDFVLGRHDDMLAVVLAQEMASTSMSFAIQITSRMVEAYREIMRMQI